MIPPTSIDGTDITGATIDGTDVQEITVDGNVVFSSGFNNYISDDFNDNDLTRPRTGQVDGSYTAQDGTLYNDARIRPDWNTSAISTTNSGQLQIGPGNGSNVFEFACSISTSIDFPCTVEFDYNATTANPGDVFRFGFATSSTTLNNTTSIFLELRNQPFFRIRESVAGVLQSEIVDNTLYQSSGTYKLELFANTTVATNPSGQSLTHTNTNPQRTDYDFLVFDIFGDDFSNTTFLIDDFRIF